MEQNRQRNGQNILAIYIAKCYTEICKGMTKEREKEWRTFFTRTNFGDLTGRDYNGTLLFDKLNDLAYENDYQPLECKIPNEII